MIWARLNEGLIHLENGRYIPCQRGKLVARLKYMKLKSLVGRSLVGVACMSFMLGTAARASDKSEYKVKSKNSAQVSSTVVRPKEPPVILVYMTGSRIRGATALTRHM